ncbi:unnamed protein product [Oppiella nova]|uniref:Uncharacterized protein n=1 Tax=Oppiella nova TaxID=334625 RepID=A0A7R9LN85_9ACAR|nr:unnamed protein product [Oppiella nova]CAG2165305.1 unnamed protein product [Oppiella nova]
MNAVLRGSAFIGKRLYRQYCRYRRYGTDTPFVRTLDGQAFKRDVREREEWGSDTDGELDLLDTKYFTPQTLDLLAIKLTEDTNDCPLLANPHMTSEFQTNRFLTKSFECVLEHMKDAESYHKTFVHNFAINLFYSIELNHCFHWTQRTLEETLVDHCITSRADASIYCKNSEPIKHIVLNTNCKIITSYEDYEKSRAQTIGQCIVTALRNQRICGDNGVDYNKKSQLFALLVRSHLFHFYWADISDTYLRQLRTEFDGSEQLVVKEWQTLDFRREDHQKLVANSLRSILEYQLQ